MELLIPQSDALLAGGGRAVGFMVYRFYFVRRRAVLDSLFIQVIDFAVIANDGDNVLHDLTSFEA
jgi:hypothetical protein